MGMAVSDRRRGCRCWRGGVCGLHSRLTKRFLLAGQVDFWFEDAARDGATYILADSLKSAPTPLAKSPDATCCTRAATASPWPQPPPVNSRRRPDHR